MSVAQLVLAAHLLATVYMFGLIWFVQIVHYPLFARVGRAAFPDYEEWNLRRTSLVVVAPMLIEVASGLALLVMAPPLRVWLGLGVGLLGLIWISTFALQVPMHARLRKGFGALTHARLVRTNWLRTVAWTARALIVVWIVLTGQVSGAAS